MFWNDITVNDIHVDNKKITYKNEPLRFQIPRGYCEYGVSEHKSINVRITNQEFLDWFRTLERHIFPENLENFESNLQEDTIRLKICEGFTQVFDSDSVFMMDGHTYVNCDVDVLVDISSKYSPFKDFNKHGLVCKVYQIRVISHGCLFSID
jgi:hypothetical protein